MATTAWALDLRLGHSHSLPSLYSRLKHFIEINKPLLHDNGELEVVKFIVTDMFIVFLYILNKTTKHRVLLTYFKQ